MTHDTRSVAFENGSNSIAGDLRVPDTFDSRHANPAIVLATPGSSVKGQIGANYASRLADFGFVTLTFDPSHQGQSEGEPRDLEDPATRVEDLRCAIDFLTGVEGVGPDRIGLLGVCAGGGYAVKAATMDRRVAALGTVVAVDIGRAMRESAAIAHTLDDVGRQRIAEARGGEQRRDPWLPDTPEQARAAGITDRDVLDAIDYYRTARGFDEHSTNRLLFRSMANLLAFNAFDLVPELLTQPVQIVVGGRKGSTGSYDDGFQLAELAPNAEKVLVIDGAGHYDMYDKPQFVDPAVEQLAEFFGKRLD